MNRHKADAWGFTVAVSMFCSLLQFTASAEIPFSDISELKLRVEVEGEENE
jgi:hypothetical protein